MHTANGDYINSNLPDVSASDFYSNVDFKFVEWFVSEKVSHERKMHFCFRATKIDLCVSENDENEF